MNLYSELIRVARASDAQKEDTIVLLQKMVQEKIDTEDIQSCMYRLNGTLGSNLDHVLALIECMTDLSPQELYIPTQEHKDLLIEIDRQKIENQKLRMKNQETEHLRTEIKLLEQECEELKAIIKQLEEI